MTQAFTAAASAIQQVFWPLVAPACLFIALCVATKGKRALDAFARSWRESGTNLLWVAFDTLLMMPVLIIALGFIKPATSGVILPIDWDGAGAGACLIAAVLIGDLVGYWRHRLEHSAWLWPSHAIHHSDTALTWLSLLRFHPINRLSTVAIDSAALMMLGLPAWAIVANSLIRNWYGYFIHADLPWMLGPARIVLVSPVMHRWHHVADESLAGKNFATVFSFWDRMFGTLHVPGPCLGPLGVPLRRSGFFWQFLHPFLVVGRGLARTLSKIRAGGTIDPMLGTSSRCHPRASGDPWGDLPSKRAGAIGDGAVHGSPRARG